MSNIEITFARVRLGGRPEEIVLGKTPNGQVVYAGGGLAIHIPDSTDPALLTALSQAFAKAGLTLTTQNTIKAVA